jgi:hypothetical protein
MISKKSLVASLIAISSFVAVPAMAAPQFLLLGGVNNSLNDAVNETVLGVPVSIKPAMGYQGGLGAEFPMGKSFGLEVDAMYQSLKAEATAAGTTTKSSFSELELPVMVRANLGRFFSLGAGGYYDVPISDGLTSDYGYVGSLRIMFPMKSMGFFLDGRYAGGLKTPDLGDKNKGWEGLVGITLGGHGSRY